MRLRFRKRYRRGQRQVEAISAQTEQGIETHIFGRFGRLRAVRRFVISWLLLFVLLIGVVLSQTVLLGGYYQSYQPVPGGTYSEGIVGRFTTSNPLFVSNPVDTSVSRLLFSGLFTYDANNQLVGDIASDFTVDDHGTVYTVHLKPKLTWQDGQPLTARDVVFTY
ncbi:MAG: ABC transporter substrate-binding protein, partial [Candidatus Saccharimonadales bacterium]